MVYFLYALAGALLVNAVPHLVHGVSGSSFQTPFASPPGVGESSALVNVYWGGFNLVVGYSLLSYAGFFVVGVNLDTLSLIIGAMILASYLALHFSKVRHPK